MKAVSVLLYELDGGPLELLKLPAGQKVLQYDKLFHLHNMLTVGKDKFSPDTSRYVYLLLNPPPLPEINADFKLKVNK